MLSGSGVGLGRSDGPPRRPWWRCWWLALLLFQPAMAQTVKAVLSARGDFNYPPYEFVQDGQPTGFNVELLHAVAETMGLQVRIELGPWAQVRQDLEQGRIDLLTGMYRSPERSRQVDFSTPFMVVTHSLFVRRGSPIHDLADAAGRAVIVQDGDIMHDYVVDHELTKQVIPVVDQAVALRLLARGEGDCALLGRLRGLYYIHRYQLSSVEPVGPPILPREFCFAVHQGQPELLSALNEGLSVLQRTGQYRELYRKWFGVLEPSLSGTILRWLLWLLVPLGVILAGVLLWSRSLRLQVAQRTAALAASRQRYRELVEESPDLILTIDVTGKLLSVNHAATRLLGYEPRKLVGRDAREFLTEASQRLVSEHLQQVLAGATSVEFEMTARAADGGLIEFETVARPLTESGHITAIQATSRDITARCQAEAAMRRLYFALEQVAEGVLIAERFGTISYANPAVARLLGTARDELIGRPARQIARGLDPSDWDRLIAAFRREGRFEGRLPLQGADGVERQLEVTVYQVLRPDGQRHNYVGLMRDVTAEAEFEEQLRNTAKMEAVGRLAGGIAHDFNNVLTTIVGCCEMALDEARQGRAANSELQEVLQAASRAGELTRQLLSFSRGEVTQPTVLDLNHAVRALERLLRRLLGEDLELALDLHPEPLAVRVDRGQVEQVLMNLAVNARDAMPNGGRLTIHTAPRPVNGADEPLVELAVADNGIGMDPETLEHIYEPFFTTKAAGLGTGLGLATVYGIVRQWHGQLDCDSAPGTGTTFRIRLPRSTEPLAAESPSGARPSAALGHGRVLVAEDEESVRRVVRHALERAGYSVVEAADGELALGLGSTAEPRFDLLVTDLVMPRLDGIALATQLQSGQPELPVLFMTGYSDAERFGSQTWSAPTGLLRKPFTAQALVSQVQELLPPKPEA